MVSDRFSRKTELFFQPIEKFHFGNVFDRYCKKCGEALSLAQKIWPDLVSALKLYATTTSIYCSNFAGRNNNRAQGNIL